MADDAVLRAAQPLLQQSLNGFPHFGALTFKTSGSTLYVTATFPQYLGAARDRMLPVFTAAGWGFKEDQRKPRLAFSLPHTVARTNLRVVK